MVKAFDMKKNIRTNYVNIQNVHFTKVFEYIHEYHQRKQIVLEVSP